MSMSVLLKGQVAEALKDASSSYSLEVATLAGLLLREGVEVEGVARHPLGDKLDEAAVGLADGFVALGEGDDRLIDWLMAVDEAVVAAEWSGDDLSALAEWQGLEGLMRAFAPTLLPAAKAVGHLLSEAGPEGAAFWARVQNAMAAPTPVQSPESAARVLAAVMNSVRNARNLG
jgi:hypothetical protein